MKNDALIIDDLHHKYDKRENSNWILDEINLKIENEELRNDLEEIYDVLTFKYDYGSANSEKITAWFNSKMIQNKTMNQEKVFNENYDFELYKYLSDRRRTEVGRLYGIENTTEKLKKVIEKVKREGLF